MSKNRNLADLLDSTGDIKSDALDNVPPSDVVNDTTPQLGGNLDTNGNDVNFSDGDKAVFGASNDLQIYHDGSNSIVNDSGTGSLLLQGNNLYLQNAAGTEYYVVCLPNEGVNLRYDNAVKLTTTSSGVDVTGNVYLINGQLDLSTNYRVRWGGTNDYSIMSDAANYIQFNTAGSERMRIKADGDVVIGTTFTSSSEKLKVYSTGDACYFQCASGGEEAVNVHRSSAQGTFVNFINNNGSSCGNIHNANGVNNVTYSTSSDYRLKENVVDMTGAIDRVKTLQPKRFSWIEQELDSANTDGFLAHEVSTIIPEAVTGTKDAVEVWEEWEELPEGVSVGDNKTDEDGNTIPVYQGIDYAKLTPLLTGALQEAIAKIEALETTVADLTTRIETLENA